MGLLADYYSSRSNPDFAASIGKQEGYQEGYKEGELALLTAIDKRIKVIIEHNNEKPEVVAVLKNLLEEIKLL